MSFQFMAIQNMSAGFSRSSLNNWYARCFSVGLNLLTLEEMNYIYMQMAADDNHGFGISSSGPLIFEYDIDKYSLTC